MEQVSIVKRGRGRGTRWESAAFGNVSVNCSTLTETIKELFGWCRTIEDARKLAAAFKRPIQMNDNARETIASFKDFDFPRLAARQFYWWQRREATKDWGPLSDAEIAAADRGEEYIR